MKTIYEQERPGLSRQRWKRRKKQLKRMGMRPGQWHNLHWKHMTMGTIQAGMIIQNKKHGNEHHVVEVHSNYIVVLDVKDVQKPDWRKRTKPLKKMNLFQWVGG